MIGFFCAKLSPSCLPAACIIENKNGQVYNILFLLREFTTADCRRLIHVIVTHAPERVADDALGDIAAKEFSFLGDCRGEEVLRKVDLVSLLRRRPAVASDFEPQLAWLRSPSDPPGGLKHSTKPSLVQEVLLPVLSGLQA